MLLCGYYLYETNGGGVFNLLPQGCLTLFLFSRFLNSIRKTGKLEMRIAGFFADFIFMKQTVAGSSICCITRMLNSLPVFPFS